MPKYEAMFEGFLKTHWRAWFMGQISALDDTSPNEAAKTPEGRKKLEELLAFYDSMNTEMGPGSIQANPDSGWVRWRLGMPGGASEEEGAGLFAEEERIFRGDDTVAAMMLNHPKAAGVNLAGADICNVCLRQGKTMLCGKCKYRRFCSSECQKRDWPDHKRYCCVGGGGGADRRQKEKEKTKQSLSKQWAQLKAHITKEHQVYVKAIMGGVTANPTGVDQGAWPHCKRPTWRELLQAAVDRGVLQPGVVAADAAGAVSSAELSSLGVTTETTEALFELKLSLMTEVGRTQEQMAYSKALHSLQTTAMQAFDGKLHPEEYLKLPQRPVGIDVSFCAVMMNKNGQKEMYVNVVWHEYGRHSDDTQSTYMKAPVLSHTRPALIELLQAIHVSITAPTGSLFGSDVPHRPTTLRLVRRWGEEYYRSVRIPLHRAGIQCLFTSEEETLKECAEAGTDPDGNNFFF